MDRAGMYLFTLNRQKWVFKGKFELGFFHFFSLSLSKFLMIFQSVLCQQRQTLKLCSASLIPIFQQISCTTEKQILATQFVTIRLVLYYIYMYVLLISTKLILYNFCIVTLLQTSFFFCTNIGQILRHFIIFVS